VAAVQQQEDGLRYGTAAGRWVIVATVLGSGIAALDATVVGIALPAIRNDFHTGVAALQWVSNAYTLTLAGLLLLGGALGDRFGRRRTFVFGTVWFAAASALCGVAPNAATLVVARALQGIGAALLTPGSLAILQASFSRDDRSKAIGAWSGLGGVASAVGPFLGGWLIAAVSWRLVFFINLPLAVAVVAIAARHVPETADPEAGRVDGTGAVAITATLVGLTYGLIEGPTRGWTSPTVVSSLVAGAVLLVAFLAVERRRRSPLVPLSIFRSQQFSATNAVTFIVYAALGGVLFLLPIVLQTVSGYSPLVAGTSLLPITAIMLALSARSGALAARIGPRLQLTVGPLVIAAGLALLVRVGHGGYVTHVLPAMLVFGFGLAINVAPLTATVLAAAPAEHAGVASAVNNDVARSGGLIAVAVLPAAAGITSEAFAHATSLGHGFHNAVLIAAAACVIAGVVAALTIHNPERPRRAVAHALDRELHCCLDAPPLRGHHHRGSPSAAGASLAPRSPDRTAPSM
jgi:EmrB/QacA subfamily drug resistance transporter